MMIMANHKLGDGDQMMRMVLVNKKMWEKEQPSWDQDNATAPNHDDDDAEEEEDDDNGAYHNDVFLAFPTKESFWVSTQKCNPLLIHVVITQLYFCYFW